MNIQRLQAWSGSQSPATFQSRQDAQQHRQLVLPRELVPLMRVNALKLTRYLTEHGPAAAIDVEVISALLPASSGKCEADLLASVSDSIRWFVCRHESNSLASAHACIASSEWADTNPRHACFSS